MTTASHPRDRARSFCEKYGLRVPILLAPMAGACPVGLAAARNRKELFIQVYYRDTGEKMWDISAPVYVNGKHWGGFRIGYTMDKQN